MGLDSRGPDVPVLHTDGTPWVASQYGNLPIVWVLPSGCWQAVPPIASVRKPLLPEGTVLAEASPPGLCDGTGSVPICLLFTGFAEGFCKTLGLNLQGLVDNLWVVNCPNKTFNTDRLLVGHRLVPICNANHFTNVMA